MKEKILSKPVKPVKVKDVKVSNILYSMSDMAFQARNLGTALKIWEKMLQDKITIFLGIAGALIPAGMRNIFVYLIENRFIDCIVSTGANLYHDLHETLNWYHYQGSEKVDDEKLKELSIDRIYDVFADEVEFRKSDAFVTEFALQVLDSKKLYTTREFLNLLGKYLVEKKIKVDGIMTSGYKNNIPIYSPAIHDSSIGIGLFDAMSKFNKHIKFDIIRDVAETGEIVKSSKNTGVIYLGGGTPKNFIQQAAIVPAFSLDEDFSHKYAIQITADSPHWGGLSGCTLEEAKSWGKVKKDASNVTVNSEITIALPILVHSLCERMKGKKRKFIPKFDWSKNRLKISY